MRIKLQWRGWYRKGDEVELYTLESEFFKTVKTSEIELCTF